MNFAQLLVRTAKLASESVSIRWSGSALLALLGVVWLSACESTRPTTTEAIDGGASTDAQLSAGSADVAETHEPVESEGPAYDATLGLASFDKAWQLINDTHFDTEFNGVDWAQVRMDYRPEAEAATTERELRRVIRRMIRTLEQSHFALLPRETVAALDPKSDDEATDDSSASTESHASSDSAESTKKRPGEIGLEFRILDREVVVTRVADDSSALHAGVRPGWVIRRVATLDIEKAVENIPADIDERLAALQVFGAVTARLAGDAGEEVEIEFLNAQNNIVEVSITRAPRTGTPVKLGNLPTFFADLSTESIEGPNGAEIGVIRFNIWMPAIARPFHEAVDRFRDSDGIIIDLRGNPGGAGGMAMGISGHFLTERLTLGTMKTRTDNLHFVSNPRYSTADGQRTEPFDGPVALLVDSMTGSTSEVFGGGMQAIGRARVFGETSMGAALPARVTGLPNGDVLLHAFADFVDANGVRLEARGVVPDDFVILSRGDLLAGHDPVVSAASAWILESQTDDDGSNNHD